MVAGVLAAVLLVAAVLGLLWRRGGARARLRRVAVRAGDARSSGVGGDQSGVDQSRGDRRGFDRIRWASVAAGISAAVVLGGWVGLVGGLVTGAVLDRALRRMEPRAMRQARLAAAAELPFAVDLLAASLQAGAPPVVALRAVATALGGPLAERLRRVAYGLELGAPAPDAWAHLREVAGGARVAAAAVRSSQSGAALAGSLIRLADELRTARAMACEAAARRSGVLVVLPLGLCFLPAFVLAGLVPVVLGVLGEVMP